MTFMAAEKKIFFFKCIGNTILQRVKVISKCKNDQPVEKIK